MSMEQEKVITIEGKKMNYGKLSNDELVKLYYKLKKKEAELYKKINDYNEKYDFLPKKND